MRANGGGLETIDKSIKIRVSLLNVNRGSSAKGTKNRYAIANTKHVVLNGLDLLMDPKCVNRRPSLNNLVVG